MKWEPSRKCLISVVCILLMVIQVLPAMAAPFSNNVKVNQDTTTERQGGTYVVEVSGTIYVSYGDKRSGSDEVYLARSTNGGQTWVETKVSDAQGGQGGGEAGPPIAVSGNTVYVAYTSKISNTPHVYVAKSTDGGATFTQHVKASDGPIDRHSLLQDMVLRNGKLYLAYLDDRVDPKWGNAAVYFTRSDDGGQTFTADVKVNPSNELACECCRITLDADGQGKVWVFYRNNANDQRSIVLVMSSDDGQSFGSPKYIQDKPWPVNFCPGSAPNIKKVGDTFHVTWMDDRNTTNAANNKDIFYDVSTDGGLTWGTDIQILPRPNNQDHPDIETDSNGNIYVVFEDDAKGTYDIYSMVSTNGGKSFKNKKIVNDVLTGKQGEARIYIDKNDKAHVVWNDYRNTDSDVFYSSAVDLIPPEVVSTIPVNKDTDVAVDSDISIQFTEDVPLSSFQSAFFIEPNKLGTFSTNGNISTFNPDTDMAAETEYNVTLTGVTDAANNIMSPFVFSFTTGIAQDTTAPWVDSISPSDLAKLVPVTAPVVVSFSEPMVEASVESAFSISPNIGNGSFSWNTTGDELIFDHDIFEFDTTYFINITTGAEDLAGFGLDTDYSMSFTTEKENIPPTVVSTSPADQAMDISIGTVISVTFSEPMGDMSGMISLVPNTAGTITLDIETAIFTPDAPLSTSTSYNVTVSSSSSDLTKNQLGSDYTFSFTTEAGPPDVSLKEFSVSDLNPILGEEVNLNVTAHNLGESVASGHVLFKDGNDTIANRTILIAPNGQYELLAYWQPTSEGSHQLSVEAFVENDAQKNNNRATLNLEVGVGPSVKRTALGELFTGLWCGPCAAADHSVSRLADQYPREDLVLLVWHIQDDFSPIDGSEEQRKVQMNIQNTPTFVINGMDYNIGGNPNPNNTETFDLIKAQVDSNLNMTSPISIDLSGTYDQTKRSASVTLTTKRIGYVPDENLTIRLILYDDKNQWVGNHHERYSAVETLSKEGLDLSLDQSELSRTFTLPEGLSDEHFGVVAFIESSTEVYQSADLFLGIPKVPTDIGVSDFEKDLKELRKGMQVTFSFNVTALSNGATGVWVTMTLDQDKIYDAFHDLQEDETITINVTWKAKKGEHIARVTIVHPDDSVTTNNEAVMTFKVKPKKQDGGIPGFGFHLMLSAVMLAMIFVTLRRKGYSMIRSRSMK